MGIGSPIAALVEIPRKIIRGVTDKPCDWGTTAFLWDKMFPNEAKYVNGKHAGPLAMGKAGRLVERAVWCGGMMAMFSAGWMATGGVFSPLNLVLGAVVMKCASVPIGLGAHFALKIGHWFLGGVERLFLPKGAELPDGQPRNVVNLNHYSPANPQPSQKPAFSQRPGPKVDFNTYAPPEPIPAPAGNWLYAAQQDSLRTQAAYTQSTLYNPSVYAPIDNTMVQNTVPGSGQINIPSPGRDTVQNIQQEGPHGPPKHHI